MAKLSNSIYQVRKYGKGYIATNKLTKQRIYIEGEDELRKYINLFN